MKIQQGDVLIWTEAIPNDAKPRKSTTVAVGEATGHHHTITDGDVEMYERDGVLYCRVVGESATLTHQTHGPVTLPRGEFRFGVVVEYDYFKMAARPVVD